MSLRTRVAEALAVAMIAGATALFPWTAPAWAHNTLTSSSPEEGAELATPPERIELVYNEPVGRQFSQVTVTGPGGDTWQDGEPRVDGDTVVQPLRPLGPAGTYTVSWRVVSADGHPISGSYTFTLTRDGPGGDSAEGESSEPPAENDSEETTESDGNEADRNGPGDGADRSTGESTDAEAAGGQGPPWGWIGLALVGALAVAGVVLGGVRGRRRRTES